MLRRSKNRRRLLKESASPPAIYCPILQRLKTNIGEELEKFLVSLRERLIEFRKTEEEIIKPLEKSLRIKQKQLKMLDLKLNSLVYWRKFHNEFIKHSSAIMELFSLTDFRPIETAVECLPEVLQEYVTDNLKLWRNFHADKKYSLEYLKELQAFKNIEAKLHEDVEKEKLIQELLEFADEHNLFAPKNLDEPTQTDRELEIEPGMDIKKWFVDKTEQVMLKDRPDGVLERIPTVNKRKSTQEWHINHYGTVSKTFSLSDEDLSSLHSSLEANKTLSECDRVHAVSNPLAADSDEDEDDGEDPGWDTFFGDA